MNYTKEEMTGKVVSGLVMDPPIACSHGSNDKTWWTCTFCGKKLKAYTYNVFKRRKKGCGRCNYFSKEEMVIKVINGLVMDPPTDCSSGSGEKTWWRCHCGKHFEAYTRSVFRGTTKSCGHCSDLSEEYMISWTSKSGVRMDPPMACSKGSNKLAGWKCHCGQLFKAYIYNVFYDHTTSCGNCGMLVKKWHHDNKDEIRKLKVPIECGFICGGPIYALERIMRSHDPFLAICSVCKNKYYPRLHDIKLGWSLTCGCISHKISWPVVQISEFINESLGLKTEFEYKVGGMSFDIFVNDKNLLIEYDGLRWHSSTKQKERDLQKYLKAVSLGFSCFRIQEVDWKKENRDNTKEQLVNLLVSGDLS